MALSRLAPALPLARRLASVALSRGGTTAGVRLSAVFTSVGATRRYDELAIGGEEVGDNIITPTVLTLT